MLYLVRAIALVLTVVLCVLAGHADAGERDALIVREARLVPSARGRCSLELLFTPDPSFRPKSDTVSVAVAGVELLRAPITRTPEGTGSAYPTRWVFRSRTRQHDVAVKLDLERGVLKARGRRIDLAALASSDGATVPVVLTLGTASRSTTVSFRAVHSTWRFVSWRDAVPAAGSQPPFRTLANGDGYIAGPGPVVVRTAREYRELMARAGFPPARTPLVDFSQEIVIAMSLGHSLPSCALPSVEIADVTRTGDDIAVRLSVVRPVPLACTDAYVFYDVAVVVAVPRVAGAVVMW